MSEITPERIAAAACEGVSGWRHSLEASLSLTAQGDVLSLAVVRWDGPDDAEVVRHYKAVVVEGETAPIVLERPEITDPSAVTGPRFGEEVGESLENGWSVFATNHVLFGGTGHISPAEARRFAAALVATADALEATQAQTGRAS